MKKIDNINDKTLDVFARMNEPQLRTLYEPHGGIFIAESEKVTRRALDAGYEPQVLLVDEKLWAKPPYNTLIDLALSRNPAAEVYAISHEALNQLTGSELTGGVFCSMKRRKLPNAEELCKSKHRIAILEHVTNPTNVGAIIRSAAAMNIEAVLLTPDCSDPLYRRAARVSMGTVFQLPWTFTENALDIAALGFTTAALALSDDSISIASPELKSCDKLALILGSEGYGLQEKTIAGSDYVVKIPMNETIDSLNVAAASAVAFWEVTK